MGVKVNDFLSTEPGRSLTSYLVGGNARTLVLSYVSASKSETRLGSYK